MIKLNLVFLLLIVSPLQLAAEDTHRILSNAFEQVSSAESIAFDFEVQLITVNENRAKESYRGFVRKKEGNVLQSFQGRTTLVTAEAVVFLDPKKKLIRFTPRDSTNSSGNLGSFSMDWKRWTNELEQFEYAGNSQDLHHFVRSNLAEVITDVDIFVSVDTGMINRVEYIYNEDLTGGIKRAVVKYIWHDQDIIDQTDFSLSQFIKFEEGIPRPSNAYSSFQLILGKKNEK